MELLLGSYSQIAVELFFINIIKGLFCI